MKHKYICFIMGFLSVCSVIARMLQLLFCTDPNTGFVYTGVVPKMCSFVFFICLFLVALFSIIFPGFFSHRQPTDNPKHKEFPILTISSLFLGFTSLIFGTISAVTSASGFTSVMGLLHLILSMFTAFFFLLEGARGFSNVKVPKFLTISPVLYFTFLLIDTYISTTGLAAITENLLYLFFLCTALVFFILHGKLLSHIDFRKSARQIYPMGFLTFIMGAVCSVPEFILVLTGKAVYIHNGFSFKPFFILIVSLYSIIYTLLLYCKRLNYHPHIRSVADLDYEPPISSAFLYDDNIEHSNKSEKSNEETN